MSIADTLADLEIGDHPEIEAGSAEVVSGTVEDPDDSGDVKLDPRDGMYEWVRVEKTEPHAVWRGWWDDDAETFRDERVGEARAVHVPETDGGREEVSSLPDAGEKREKYDAAGDQADADWYHEWRVEDGSLKSRGWTPLLEVDHDGLTEWQQACREAIEAGIDLSQHEGDVVFRSWAHRSETGVSWEALVDGIDDPEIPDSQ